MKQVCRLGQFTFVGIAVISFLLTLGVATAWAESPTWLCVPKTAGEAVTSGGTGTEAKCKTETTTIELPPAAELPALASILSHMKYVASGIDSKPTVKFEGVNVQIVNGEGKTTTTNGEGNLVIGYDENPEKREQTGSHNLILGKEQKFTSYSGIIAGAYNSITAPFASVTDGFFNNASGEYASASGGSENAPSGRFSTISGGNNNEATMRYSTVSGGNENHATGEGASISGGATNTVSGFLAWVGGGFTSTASGEFSAVSGGSENKAEGYASSISGGEKNKTASGVSSEASSIGGGDENKVEAKYSSVFGGKLLTTTKEYEALL
jgi:hypothetical protein